MEDKEYDVLLPLTKDELLTLWQNCYFTISELETRKDPWGIKCHKKAMSIKEKISKIQVELNHKESCEDEIKRVYGDSFVSCDFRTETPYKSKNGNMIYAYRVYYRDTNQETYESELKACTCEVEIIPVTTDEHGEELEDTEDVDFMYEIIEDGE